MDHRYAITRAIFVVGCLAVGCGDEPAASAADTGTGGSSTSEAQDESTTSSTTGTTEQASSTTLGGASSAGDSESGSGTTGGSEGCVVRVAVRGNDDAGCGGPGSPCATVTRGISEATEATCAVVVGPGVYSRASGELFPLRLPPSMSLRGESSDPAGEPTIFDGSENIAGEEFDVVCDEAADPLRSTVVMEGGELSDVIIRGGPGTNYATVLVLGGDNTIFRIRVEGGQEGIFTAGTSSLGISASHLSGAGHAALKPAGDSVVDVEGVVMTQSKDALEPICRATVTVTNSEAFCNGNGLEALDRATTMLFDNDVHHNINGIAARGVNTVLVANGNRIHDNSFGIVEMFGAIELGTAATPGENDLAGNRFAALMLNNVPARTDAIGNRWQPGVDGANAMGEFTGDVSITGPICGANNIEVEAPIPEDCDPNTPAARDPAYQNFALNDGSCSAVPTCGEEATPCPPLGPLVLAGG